MISTELIAGLKTVISDQQIKAGDSFDIVLGNNGHTAVFPKSEEEIAGILKYANEQGKKVNIMAGGTKRGFGGLEDVADILLSLENYQGTIEHTVGDMTLTVKSGTPFQKLQDFLAEHQQKIPLDPAQSGKATIGGVIAANDSGPKRLGYGSARDMVIGLKMIYPDGTIIRSGGKTVKNVAGYDMNKLFIGSMGTLGVISEVTLKLRPLPKYESLVLISFPDSNLEDIRNFTINLLDSAMEPTALELLSPSLAQKLTGKSSYTLAISFEDVENSVRYQVAYVKDQLHSNLEFSVLSQEAAKAFWKEIADIQVNQEIKAALKIGVKNMDVLQIIRECQPLQDLHNLVVEAHGGLGHGLCMFYLTGGDKDVVSAILTLRTYAEKMGGYAVVTHLPLAMRQKIAVWGAKPAYFFLLEGIKTKVDPNGTLNSRRFVGGI